MPSPRLITIDGPSCTGKSTVLVILAAERKLLPLSIGRVMRCVTARLGGVAADPALIAATTAAITPKDLADPRLTDEALGLAAARLFTSADSRQPVIDHINTLAAAQPAIIDGRAMGTVYFPQAVGLYLTADLDHRVERAQRHNPALTPDECRRQLQMRDAQEERQFGDGALRPGVNSIVIDTNRRTAVQVAACAHEALKALRPAQPA